MVAAGRTLFTAGEKEREMLRGRTSPWWSFLIRGIAAIAFGVLAIVQPGIALASLILVFAAYALVDGVFAVLAGLAGRNIWLILAGALGIIVGVYAYIRPDLTALALLTVIGVWAILTGAAEIVAAYRLRRLIHNEVLLALGGLVSVIFGIYVIVSPGGGALAVLTIIALYAIAAGVLYLMLGWRVRSVQNHLASTAM
jgi:uncharacterized membrane protein HdeD (DUF308 family)